MSYPGFPSNDFASWPFQQVQQGNTNHQHSLMSQVPIPQYPLAPISGPGSYTAPPQGPTQSTSVPTNITSSCPPGPFSNPFPNPYLNPFSTSFPPTQFPAQFSFAPLPHAGTSAPAYGSFENLQGPIPQPPEPVQDGIHPSEYPMGSQQVLPSRNLQQTDNTLSHRAQSVPTNLNLTTIHPTLGLCVLVPIGALGASAPQSPGNWTTASTHGTHHRDRYNDRVDRLRRRHSRELTPYMRHTTPSPPRSYSPYLSSPSSSFTVTPILRHRHRNTPEYGRSPRRFHGIGGFTPLRSQDVPRPTIEPSISTVGTCSQCGGTGASSSYEPFTDGSAAPTPRITTREDAFVGNGESSRGYVGEEESLAEDRRRFQASVEEVDE